MAAMILYAVDTTQKAHTRVLEERVSTGIEGLSATGVRAPGGSLEEGPGALV